MNNPQSLTAITRKNFTNSNTLSYIDADALNDMNLGYREMINAISARVQDFFWTWGTTNAVISQSEYVIEQFTFSDASLHDVLSIDGVSVQYTTDGDFYKLKKGDFSGLDFDPTLYDTWGGEPFYYVRDNSIFIFPSPTIAVTGGVKIFGNYRPLDLTLSAVDTDIKTPRMYNILLCYYQAYMYWSANLRDDKAQMYQNKFMTGINEMVESLATRDREIMGYEY